MAGLPAAVLHALAGPLSDTLSAAKTRAPVSTGWQWRHDVAPRRAVPPPRHGLMLPLKCTARTSESELETALCVAALMRLTLRPTRAFRAQHYLNMIITRKHGSALPFITVTATGRKDKLQ